MSRVFGKRLSRKWLSWCWSSSPSLTVGLSIQDVIYLLPLLGVKKGAWSLRYSGLGLHQLGSWPTCFMPTWTIRNFILYQVCDARAVCTCYFGSQRRCGDVKLISVNIQFGIWFVSIRKKEHNLSPISENCGWHSFRHIRALLTKSVIRWIDLGPLVDS